MSNIKKRNFVDLETGEKIENVVYMRTEVQQEVIENEKRLKAYRDAQKTEKHPFYFAKMEKAKEADKMLSMKDMGYFLVMQSYISYDNMLKMKNDSKLPMTKKEVMGVLKIKKLHTLNALLKNFVELGLIFEDKVELYGKEDIEHNTTYRPKARMIQVSAIQFSGPSGLCTYSERTKFLSY